MGKKKEKIPLPALLGGLQGDLGQVQPPSSARSQPHTALLLQIQLHPSGSSQSAQSTPSVPP